MNLIKRITDKLRRKPLLVKSVVGYTEIEAAKNKIKEVRDMYNPHLHGWQYESHISYTANKMQEILNIFTACK